LFLHWQSEVFPNREAFYFALERFLFNGNPLRESSTDHRVQGVVNRLDFPAFFDHFYRIAYIDKIRGDIDPLPVHQEMIVPDEVPPLGSGINKPESVDNIIQTTLKGNEQIGPGDTPLPVSPLKKKPELLFGKAVSILYLLLFTELNAIIRRFTAATLAMLAGCIASPIESTFIGVTTISL
jgi:hypothetical protein